MSHLSGVCSNCGKPKEEHFGLGIIEHEAFEYHLANNRWKDEIVFFEGHDKDTVMMALGKQSTSFEESQELKFKPGIYSCEIPPFEVVEQWKHKGSYTWADGEPHSSIVGRVELEYRKIIRLK